MTFIKHINRISNLTARLRIPTTQNSEVKLSRRIKEFSKLFR